MRFRESGEGARGPEGGAKGSCGSPGTPWVSSPVLEEGGSSLVGCMMVVWWLYGGAKG